MDVASISLRSSPLRVPRCRRGQAVLIQGLTSYQAQSRTVNQKTAFLYGIDWELQNSKSLFPATVCRFRLLSLLVSTTDGLLSSLSLASIKPSFDAIAMVQKLTPRTLLAGLAVVTSITEVDQDLTVEIRILCPACNVFHLFWSLNLPSLYQMRIVGRYYRVAQLSARHAVLPCQRHPNLFLPCFGSTMASELSTVFALENAFR